MAKLSWAGTCDLFFFSLSFFYQKNLTGGSNVDISCSFVCLFVGYLALSYGYGPCMSVRID